MADNYLERAMDDLHSGRLRVSDSRLAASAAGKMRRKGEFAGQCFVVVGGASGNGLLKAIELRRKGASVDIIDSDSPSGVAAGQAAAQKYSLKFWPADISNKDSVSRRIEEIKSFRKTSPVIQIFQTKFSK